MAWTKEELLLCNKSYLSHGIKVGTGLSGINHILENVQVFGIVYVYVSRKPLKKYEWIFYVYILVYNYI